MARRCPNKNTGEYRALQAVYETEVRTNDVINTWQDLNNSEAFPTVLEAEEMVQDQKLAFALKQQDFASSLLTNLRRERIGSMYQGTFFVNNSNPATREYDEMFLSSNLKRLKRYLKINNIPESTVSITRTAKSYIVQVNEDMFTSRDLIEKSRSWNTPRSRAVVMHLKRMFPQVQIKMLAVNEAREFYDNLPEWKKNNVPFNDVKSFYVDGVAYLIKGRVTDETAIEEMLHPFVDAIKAENEELFNSLLGEVTTNFPAMVQEIEAAYNSDTRNFNQVERDLEIVTQGLSRHFKKEYEESPTKGFLDRVAEMLDWFMELINNFNQYLTGRPLTTTAIKPGATMTDIAKLLNTEGIQFKLEKRVDGKVRFSLSPQKQKIIDSVLSESNGIQKNVIKKLFHQAMTTEEVVDSLSANINNNNDGSTIVTLNEEDHTYVDITNGEIYTSVTTAIKGQLKNLEDVQLNLDIGNDVDALLDALVSHQTVADVMDQMNVLNEEQAREAYNTLSTTLNNIMLEGDIALSQVVVFDESTKLAGTADLVIVDKHGRIKIVDLKTSKNSLKAQSIIDTAAGRQQKKYYDKEWGLPEDSLLKQAGVDKLSTRAQHNLQVNLYRRMFHNMGYEVYEGDRAASTIHFTAGITGKGKNQKFNGEIKSDQFIDHPPSENLAYVNKLVPLLDNNAAAERLESEIKNAEDAIYEGKNQIEEDENVADNIDAQEYPEYNTINGALKNYQTALINKRTALDQVKSAVYMDRTKEAEADQLSMTIAYINIAMSEGPISRSIAFTELLQDALKQIRNFTEYIEDPKNYGKPEYITYVLNFDRFISTFQGLHSIDSQKELNATQRSLVLSLQLELNKLSGGTNANNEGLVNEALYNYVKEVVRTRSSNQWGADGSMFTMEDLDSILKEAEDISMGDLYTRDIATSPDVLLAVMDKIYKAKKQELLDRIGEREKIIRQQGQKLLKLSNTKDLQKIYDFMLEFDEDGGFTGFYVKKIGQQYYDLQNKLRSELYDNEGDPYQYRDISNLDDAKQEDIDYNIDLANKKAALGKFFRAEIKNESGDPVDGEYHGYTQEFKNARDQYEYWVPGDASNPIGNWYRKPGISDAKYATYEAKYFDQHSYVKAIRVNGEPTGAIVKDQTYRAPKVKYRFVREVSRSGQRMTSEKYDKIMNPTNALEVAQKEFYQTFVDLYENDLLKKLPGGVMNQMLGRVTLVQNNVVDELKGKSTLWNKMYASTVQSRAWNMFKTTQQQKGVTLDENGNIVNSMPVFYTGKPKLDTDIADVNKEINALNEEYKKGKILPDAFRRKQAELNGKLARLRSTPSLGQINKDMTESLLKFSAMAENYETMGTIDDTLRAFVQVIEKRKYQASGEATNFVARSIDGTKKVVGIKSSSTSQEANTIKRAKKWMNMVYYDNELQTKGAWDKIADGLIQLSSLSYVAFNPFGNFNNYLIGRVNNNIEMLGGRFFNRNSFLRSSKEFNKKALYSLVQRTSYDGKNTRDLADIVTLGVIPGLKKSDYDPERANNKWEAFVDMFRMMDKMSDVREQGGGYETQQGRSWFSRAAEWGYVLQDAAEYNVQTKVGMAMLMDITLRNNQEGHPEFGQTLSLYDAFVYDSETHENKLKEGYNEVVTLDSDGNVVSTQEYTDAFRYDLRNKIREVNKQIHGNYAKEDRMVIQSNTIGNLAAQFKKWVAPAIRARYQREYFDQNLGWMEGRYRSFWSFLGYAKRELVRGNVKFNTYGDGFMEAYGADGKGGNRDQRAQNKLFGFYRTMGEIGIVGTTLIIGMILDGLLANDGEDDDLTKRMKNFVRYTADRTYKETVLFNPIPGVGGYTQVYQMFNSPMAAARTMGELAEFLQMLAATPIVYFTSTEDEFYGNSKYVYQQGKKRGQLKVYKNFKDVFPIVYAIQKWDSYLKNDNFYIK